MKNRMNAWTMALVMLAAPSVALAQMGAPGNSPPSDAASPAPGSQSGQGMPSRSGTMSATESQARSALASAGYTDIKDLKQGAAGWEATATRDGRESKVRVSADGTVTPAPAAR